MKGDTGYDKRLISHSDVNEIITKVLDETCNDDLSNACFGSIILMRIQKLAFSRMFEYLNKSRIGESFNVLLNVMQHDGEVKIDLDSISAEDAEKIVRLLNEALE